MNEFLGLLLNGLHHVGVAVAGRAHGDARCEIKIAVAIHIPDFGAFAVRHHKRIITRVRGRNGGGVPLEDRLRLGAGHIKFSNHKFLLIQQRVSG